MSDHYPPRSLCGTCGHTTAAHDAGECWHGSPDGQCGCGWYEPTDAAVTDLTSTALEAS